MLATTLHSSQSSNQSIAWVDTRILKVDAVETQSLKLSAYTYSQWRHACECSKKDHCLHDCVLSGILDSSLSLRTHVLQPYRLRNCYCFKTVAFAPTPTPLLLHNIIHFPHCALTALSFQLSFTPRSLPSLHHHSASLSHAPPSHSTSSPSKTMFIDSIYWILHLHSGRCTCVTLQSVHVQLRHMQYH